MWGNGLRQAPRRNLRCCRFGRAAAASWTPLACMKIQLASPPFLAATRVAPCRRQVRVDKFGDKCEDHPVRQSTLSGESTPTGSRHATHAGKALVAVDGKRGGRGGEGGGGDAKAGLLHQMGQLLHQVGQIHAEQRQRLPQNFPNLARLRDEAHLYDDTAPLRCGHRLHLRLFHFMCAHSTNTGLLLTFRPPLDFACALENSLLCRL